MILLGPVTDKWLEYEALWESGLSWGTPSLFAQKGSALPLKRKLAILLPVNR